MKNSGQFNYSGINAQAWAAMSLFLQHMRDPKFSYLHLEEPGFQDFNLAFSDGRKIICESKNRQSHFSFPQLKEILENLKKNNVIGDKDEILIISPKIHKKLSSNIDHVRYFDQVKEIFRKKGYTRSQIRLLEKVKFWKVEASFNEMVIYSLFADLINFWLPVQDIERIVDHILVQKIYKGSQKGATYSRSEILKEIDELAIEAKKNSVYYNEELNKREEQFYELEKALTDVKHPTWQVPKELSAFSADFERLKFARDRLVGKKQQLVLQKWDPLWQLNRLYFFGFGIFDVFENNLHSKENIDYVLTYLKKHATDIRGFYRSDYFAVDVVKIISKIIKGPDGREYLSKSFEVIKDLISFEKDDFFYLKEAGYNHGRWEKGELSKVLRQIYLMADKRLKSRVIGFCLTHFNLTEDEGEFSNHTSKDIFDCLRDWLSDDIKNRLIKIVAVLSRQYDKAYKKYGKKLAFKGWEHMGGGTAFWGSNYRVDDRHFVTHLLIPSIENYYAEEPFEAWKFIKQFFITRTSAVSEHRPDFLNRSILGIALKRYSNQDRKISAEAYQILKEFILARRGIPHKSELIYQSVLNSDLPDDKKWRLVSLTTKKYGIPVNPFVEKIVSDLSRKGHALSKSELKKWIADPKYYKHTWHLDCVESIKAVLATDIEFGIELYTTLITSEYIKTDKRDNFDTYHIAQILHDIYKQDSAKGLAIYNSLLSQERLSVDQQIIFTHSLCDDSDSSDLMVSVYNNIIDPFLNSHENNLNKISQIITKANCRESFVQFADKLATRKLIAETLRIIRIFINDPDPYLPGKDPDDPESKYNEHAKIANGDETNSITSVRGWCGWVLMHCAVLEGREFLSETIQLTERLCKDPNYYVVHMGCHALAQLTKNRLTVLPSDKNTLFLCDDRKTALELAKKIEAMAFSLLNVYMTWSAPVQKAMAKSLLYALSPIRALNQKDAKYLVTSLVKFFGNAKKEASHILIYFAEFRKDDYKNWRFQQPGLYDDLEDFDAREFKKILIESIENIQKNDPDDCFSIGADFEHLVRDIKPQDNDYDEYTRLALEYFDILTNVYAHHLFDLIYKVIEDKLEAEDKYKDRWYDLFIKCLKVESEFYDKRKAAGDIASVSWYPSMYHPKILELIYQKFGFDKFIEASAIFFDFPQELYLHESETLVSIYEANANAHERAKQIIEILIKRDPSKYWHLNKVIKGK